MWVGRAGHTAVPQPHRCPTTKPEDCSAAVAAAHSVVQDAAPAAATSGPSCSQSSRGRAAHRAASASSSASAQSSSTRCVSAVAAASAGSGSWAPASAPPPSTSPRRPAEERGQCQLAFSRLPRALPAVPKAAPVAFTNSDLLGAPLDAPLAGHTIAGQAHCPPSCSLHRQLTGQVRPLWNGRQLGAPEFQPPQLAWRGRQGRRQRAKPAAARAAASAAAGVQLRCWASPAGAARRKCQARQLGRCRQQLPKESVPAAGAGGAVMHFELLQAGRGAATAGQRAATGELQPCGRRPRRQQRVCQLAQRRRSRPQAGNVQHRGAGAVGVGGAVGTGSHLGARHLHIRMPLQDTPGRLDSGALPCSWSSRPAQPGRRAAKCAAAPLPRGLQAPLPLHLQPAAGAVTAVALEGREHAGSGTCVMAP